MIALLDHTPAQTASSGAVLSRVVDQNEMFDVYRSVLDHITRLLKKHDVYQTDAMHLFDACLSGHNQLWRCDRDNELQGVAITTITTWPTKVKSFDILYIIGKHNRHFDDITSTWNTLIDFAKTNGCTRIVGTARPGWRRYFGPLGLKAQLIRVTKEI